MEILKLYTYAYSTTGSYRRQADEIWVNFEFLKFAIIFYIRIINFLLHLRKLQQYYSSMNLFKLVFLV